MHEEISNAVAFITKYLERDSTLNQIEEFKTHLSASLAQKYENHWYPNQPWKGNAYRSLTTTAVHTDPVLILAATNAGLTISSFLLNLPILTLWIDPSNVTFRSEFGQIFTIWEGPDFESMVGYMPKFYLADNLTRQQRQQHQQQQLASFDISPQKNQQHQHQEQTVIVKPLLRKPVTITRDPSEPLPNASSGNWSSIVKRGPPALA